MEHDIEAEWSVLAENWEENGRTEERTEERTVEGERGAKVKVKENRWQPARTKTDRDRRMRLEMVHLKRQVRRDVTVFLALGSLLALRENEETSLWTRLALHACGLC